MTIKLIRPRNERHVFGVLENVDKTVKRGVRQGMFRVSRGLIAEANREILRGRKTGRVYLVRRGTQKRRHRASAPGETHANLSGTLRKSLSFQLRGTSEIEFGYGVSAGKSAPDYARFVEFGTQKMRPRPSISNALDAEQGNIVQHLEDEIDGAFR